MIAPTKEPKLEDTTLEPKEKDTPQSATRTIPTLAGYTNLQKLKIKGFLRQQPVIILINARSTRNFMSSKVAAHLMLQKEYYNGFEVKKRKADDSTREPNNYNHNTTLGGDDDAAQVLPTNTQADEELKTRFSLKDKVDFKMILADYFLLPLNDYEAVLNIKWPTTLGDVPYFCIPDSYLLLTPS
ncbi:hypothetical protein BHE74_00037763 [Ensete ventricosum]|nr:hypothetical protein BHE74_00037763 [Ensete ventricosum]